MYRVEKIVDTMGGAERIYYVAQWRRNWFCSWEDISDLFTRKYEAEKHIITFKRLRPHKK